MNTPNVNNGSGHGIFQLAPKADPDTMAVLESKRDARRDSRLTRSMIACFEEIADRALNPHFYDAKGIVVISDSILADQFNVTTRTVFSWKYRLAQCGYVSLARKPKSNMWPITKYYLTALHRAPSEHKTDRDGTYGTGKYRPAPINPALGARHPGQPSLPLPGSRQHVPEPKSEKTPAISAQSGNSLRPRAETNFDPEPKSISAQSRSLFRPRAETNFGSEPKSISAQSRSLPPLRAEAGFRHQEPKGKVQGDLKGGEGHPTPPKDDLEKAFRAWETRLEDMRNSDLRTFEKDFKAALPSTHGDGPRDLLKRKLAAVRLRLHGPAVESLPAPRVPQPAPVRADKPLTEAQYLSAARACIELRTFGAFTQAMAAALVKAGEPLPAEVAKRFPALVNPRGEAGGNAAPGSRKQNNEDDTNDPGRRRVYSDATAQTSAAALSASAPAQAATALPVKPGRTRAAVRAT